MEESPNYYQLLGLEGSRHATLLPAQEVKAAYRRALLQHHPDKRSQNSVATSQELPKDSPATVDDIALAYKVLSEPSLRAQYDRWLRSKESDGDPKNGLKDRTHRTGLETVDLDDLAFDEDSSVWSRSCRCGEERGYIVSEAQLEMNAEDGEIIVGCKGCSLWLRVLFGVED